MNRKYDTKEYEDGCGSLEHILTIRAITTDVIVGFPGETDEEFAQTKSYLEKIRFYEMHIFKYSKREGTRAAAMKDQVAEQIKTLRSNELLQLEHRMSKEYREYYMDKPVEVLMEEPVEINGKRYFTGYTKEYVKVALETAEDISNTFQTGIITERLSDDLYLMVEF